MNKITSSNHMTGINAGLAFSIRLKKYNFKLNYYLFN